ncbi:MAG: putative sulfate exporter family transporter [Chloroflexi bacterium]|nr:putative sulfate exporter family transporter [Chloroflexota bacterium]MBT4074662.1 putative sulfate exporter family transporter [Chloroflexota bacterium]MBT4514207.1 putative sulfate exporter family transporter [Chloroflexota bacterium]MBT6680848.1 putative sulfate exporter family transporter [Chloroflexota bacterium]
MSILTTTSGAPFLIRVRPFIPGLAFSATAGVFIYLADRAVDSAYLDGLLVALVFGMVVNNLFPTAKWHAAGSKFAGRNVLEFAVMILGASVFMPDITQSGFGLLALIVTGVIGSMALAYFVGHVILGLDSKLATLVGIGNSICGNSAIAVMAPVIKAKPSDVGAAIGISAVLGASQILLLQLLAPIFGLSDYHYGIVAGMAVYAMAQVYSASAVVSQTSASVAVVVKLTRVLMLSPMVIVAQIIYRRNTSGRDEEEDAVAAPSGPMSAFLITRWVPWFVLGFIILSTFRSVGVIGEGFGADVRDVSKLLFVMAMVAIGMGVDLRSIVTVGPRVALTIMTVLIFMVALSTIAGSFLEGA